MNDIKKSLDQFLDGKDKNNGRKPDERDASFDYCYNHFYSFYKKNKLSELADEKNLQTSCLQVGFYLASWGMMRGSSFLLGKSVRNYKNLLTAISTMNPKLWEIDVDNYEEENISLLINCKQQIISALGKENKPSDTLITKIMLGVFANVPAFDQYFRKSFKVHSFNKESLLKIKNFYEENKDVFNSFKINTFDFLTAEETNIVYTKAKLIDMFGFMDGQ
ncbi:MAG: hypothetical protein HQK91_14815 [Nitrospirae bacterium]|nr:hypothetical protein [Nitrospirota bacterium]MBF0542710.1 hypothetical protein [Nitrospirota bacterium]